MQENLRTAWDRLEVGMEVRTSYDAGGRGWRYVQGRIVDKGSERLLLGSWKSDTGADARYFGQDPNVNGWQVIINSNSWVEIIELAKVKALVSLDKVILSQDKKEQILSAISQVKHNDKIFSEWGFGEVFEKGTAISLLFYGGPGTGKTLMAEAIANHLKQKFKIIQTADVESSEPGQAERNIRAFFKESSGKTVLVFDECDSLIAPRDEVGMILGAQINALLTELERYTGTVIFTTNRLGRMDPAFERRVSAKIEFPFPSKDQRVMIWKNLIPEKAPISKDVDFNELGDIPIPGGHIKNAVLNAARKAAYKELDEITMECFVEAITKELEAAEDFKEHRENQPKIPSLRGPGIGKSGGLKKEIKREVEKEEEVVHV